MIGNNRYFEGGGTPPFELVREQVVDEGSSRLRSLGVHAGLLLATRDGCLVCIDATSGETLWALRDERAKWVNTLGCGEALFTDFPGVLARVDRNTGEALWQTDDRERPWALPGTNVVTLARLDGVNEVRSRDQDSGALGWSCGFGYNVTAIANAGSTVLVLGGGAVTALDARSRERAWRFDVMSWCEANCAEAIATWKTARNEASAKRGPYFAVGPGVDDTVFVTIGVGLVIALDLDTGELRWRCDIEDPTQAADRMIYRNGRLYFNSLQLRGIASHLSCLDAVNGALLYRVDENFTPAGCANPILLDRIVLGGYHGHLTAFDVVDETVVWRYEHPRGSVFHTGCHATPNGFVASNADTNTIQWFESTATKRRTSGKPGHP